MPVCPKCGKLISDKRYERHLRRHGQHHKHEPSEVYVPSATPPFERVGRTGVLVPGNRKSTRHRWSLERWVVALALALGLIYILLWIL